MVTAVTSHRDMRELTISKMPPYHTPTTSCIPPLVKPRERLKKGGLITITGAILWYPGSTGLNPFSTWGKGAGFHVVGVK